MVILLLQKLQGIFLRDISIETKGGDFISPLCKNAFERLHLHKSFHRQSNTARSHNLSIVLYGKFYPVFDAFLKSEEELILGFFDEGNTT